MIDVRKNPDHMRYEAMVDGALAGFAIYHDHGTKRTISHTETFPEFAGRGVASALTQAALDDIRSSGMTAVPHCTFVSSWIGRNPDYRDVVDE